MGMKIKEIKLKLAVGEESIFISSGAAPLLEALGIKILAIPDVAVQASRTHALGNPTKSIGLDDTLADPDYTNLRDALAKITILPAFAGRNIAIDSGLASMGFRVFGTDRDGQRVVIFALSIVKV